MPFNPPEIEELPRRNATEAKNRWVPRLRNPRSGGHRHHQPRPCRDGRYRGPKVSRFGLVVGRR